MSVVRRALALPRSEQRDAARALGWLVLAHVALRVLPYRTVRRLAGRVRATPRRSALTADGCAAATARAAILFPGARCLARALAAECQLRRAGHLPRLHLGVGFDEAKTFLAHAWLESDGVIVTGGGEAMRCEYREMANSSEQPRR
jgi:hypothetical protein